MDQTPPPLHGPSEKDRKYDRQLRLWAANGQAALENAHILLINNTGSGTVGIEALKNIVLPGIGRFTIVDPAIVDQADLGVNFFLDGDHVGKSRAQCCAETLMELNPEVQGDWFPKSREPFDLRELLDSLHGVTIALYALPMPVDSLDVALEFGRKRTVPIITVLSLGFYSYFRVTLPGPFPIIETHPEESATLDLRLLSPWPELSEWAAELTADLETLDDHKHSHIPYVAILLHYLEAWRGKHGGKPPATAGEKAAFLKLVKSGMRQNLPEGSEENFEEALAVTRRVLLEPTLPAAVKHVLEHVPSFDDTKSTFWIIARGVKKFYELHKCLPVPGSVPDMKAQSEIYVQLQHIYKKKARQDAAEVLALAQDSAGGFNIDLAEVQLFCKNAAFIKLIEPEISRRSKDLGTILGRLLEKDRVAPENEKAHSLAVEYLAMMVTSHLSAPSKADTLTELDRIHSGASKQDRIVKVGEEIGRSMGAELHNMSAITGGLVAQEVIKIITRQYVLFDNICVFDGNTSRCEVFRL